MSDHRSLVLIDDCRTEGMLVEGAIDATEEFGTFRHVIDSRTALEVVASEKPHAVLLDLRMPGLSGWEVLAQLRENGVLNSTFVAILSNSDSMGDRKEAMEQGAKAYFVKPMDSSGYIQIIEAVAEAVR
jgi:CheY-like chemotaxis protein